MLIEFSGLDCAGKSTQINLMVDYLSSRGYAVKTVWSRGGYTPGITWLKNLARGGKGKTPEQMTVEEREAKVNAKPQGGRLLLWLSIIDLIVYWGIVFRIWSRGKNALLCDRYLSDTFIDFTLKYPKMRFERWLVWQLLLKVYRKPDCSFVLTITPEESMRRSNLKFEPFPEPQEKREKRLNLYLQEIKSGRWQYEIDCMRPIDVIHQELKSKIDENIRNA